MKLFFRKVCNLASPLFSFSQNSKATTLKPFWRLCIVVGSIDSIADVELLDRMLKFGRGVSEKR